MADKPPTVQPTISMPSADLINFRFDQNDKNIKEIKDLMTNITSTFATNERVNELEKRLDNYTWYWRAVFTGLIFALGGIIVALVKGR